MKDTAINLFLKFRIVVVLAFNIMIVTGSFYMAFLLRFDLAFPTQYIKVFFDLIPFVLLIKITTFGVCGLYNGMWRYLNAKDLVMIAQANIVAMVFLAGLEWWLSRFQGFPRSVIVLDAMICIFLMAGIRILTRFAREYFSSKRPRRNIGKRILIVGAGDAGLLLLNEYLRDPSLGRVVGFIDDDRFKQNTAIEGVEIRGYRHDIPKVVEEQTVDEIVLAIPSAGGETTRGVLAYCEQTKARIRIVPGLNKIISGEMEVRARDVRPDDLLGRETVMVNEEDIIGYVKGRVVLVTGAGGSIGSELCRLVATFGPKEILLFDHHENLVYFLAVEFRQKYPDLMVRTVIGDIRDVGLLKHVFTRTKPQVVFHAAAHKHVPLMEDSPVAAIKNNIFGTRNMIYASHHYGVERFVLISTDKAVNPINIMGMSKRVAEMILQTRAVRSRTKFMAVRFGNVLGSAGSVVPLFKLQIENGGPVTVTHPDVKRYFMSIKEACMLVLQAGALSHGGELYILDMGEQIKVVDIARNLIAFSGLTLGKDIEIKFIGLRPGEKLEEELLLDKEQDTVTQHNKIFMSQAGVRFDRALLHKNLRVLQSLAHNMDEVECLKVMRQIIEAGNR